MHDKFDMKPCASLMLQKFDRSMLPPQENEKLERHLRSENKELILGSAYYCKCLSHLTQFKFENISAIIVSWVSRGISGAFINNKVFLYEQRHDITSKITSADEANFNFRYSVLTKV